MPRFTAPHATNDNVDSIKYIYMHIYIYIYICRERGREMNMFNMLLHYIIYAICILEFMIRPEK